MKHLLLIAFCGFAWASLAQTTEEPEPLSWPREVEGQNGLITVYQPQLESYDNNILQGRAAASVKDTDSGEPIFGAFWFKAFMYTDKDKRLVYLDRLDVTEVRFPDKEEAEIEDFKADLKAEVERSDIILSLDRLLAAMEEVEEMKTLADEINNDPPDIYYRTRSTALIRIDGEPILKETDTKGYSYVVNTPFFIVKQEKSGRHYLKGGDFWYESDQILRGWTEIKKPPKKVRKMAEDAVNEAEEDAGIGLDADTELEKAVFAPEIIAVTQPSELILVDGQPNYEPVPKTNLLYVTNSQNDILMETGGQKHYVLLAGRWYASRTLDDDDWTFVEPEQLPADFAKIPEGAKVNNVRTSVPGTPEARYAVLEQSIPQTATIDRKTATTEVQYDGNPQFARIPNTSLQVAENSDKTVLRSGNTYYVVDNGVWFASQTPTGPWRVSTERPQNLEAIPPSSPAYNTKYVYIYDYTPDVVYAGYLPGYTGSYVYNGVVVYGTGFWYRPWYRRYYYPRPWTWGFNVHYNPWVGWGFSFGYSFGWFNYGWHPRPYWWGPCGYRFGYRHGYYNWYPWRDRRYYNYNYRYGYNYRGRVYGPRPAAYSNVYRSRRDGVVHTGVTRPTVRPGTSRPSTRPGTSRPGTDRPSTRPGTDRPSTRPGTDRPSTRPGTDRPSTRPGTDRPSTRPGTDRPSTRPGTDRPSTRPGTDRPSTRPGTRPSTRPTRPPTTRPSTRPNDVYSDRRGNVYRRDQSGNWQQRDRSSWNQPNRRPQSLDRSYQSRSRGNINYNRSRQVRPQAPRSQPSRSGSSGRRGGG